MGKNSKLGPFSSKFCYYDDRCTSIFRIPSRLVKIYGDDLAQMATLRINHSQKFWKVSVEKIKGQHFFTKGWKEFAQEAGMKTGEYLLFRAAGLCEFHVSPKKSDDEKELTSGSEDEGSFTDAENSTRVGKCFTFTVELESWHKEKLRLPRKFIKRPGLKWDKGLILQNVEGRQWPIRLTRSCCKYALTAGWVDFLIANKVAVGSMMSLKFVSGSNKIIEARVIKQGTNSKELFNFVNRSVNMFDISEPNKTGDVARGAENSHKACEVGEFLRSSRKTSEPTERPENLYGMKEHAEGRRNLHVMMSKHSEGSENSNKTSEDTEEPDKIPTMCEHAEGPENSRQTSRRTEEPKHIDKTSDIAKGPGNVHRPSGHGEGPKNVDKTSGHAEGPEKSHANTRTEKEEQFSEEEIDFRAERRWRFMKKLKKHNAYKLDIPRHISKVIGKTAKEERKLQDRKGRKWPLRLEYRTCGAYTIVSGWIDFLVGNKVYVGSTVSFEFIPSKDKNVIEAWVSENGENGMELFVKKASGRPRFHTPTVHVARTQKSHGNVKSGNEDHLMEEEISEEYSDVVRRWTFSKKLKKHDAYKLNIPRDVSKAIENTKTGEIKLQDCKGRKWPVRLEYRTSGAYTMISGWIDFLVGNKVYVGTTVSFEFIPSKDKNIIEAWVTENGEKGTEPFIKRAQGRPPCQ